MKRKIFIFLLAAISLGLHAQTRKVQNRPYIDQRKVHYGFMIGLHTQDLEFTNNGFITDTGESWFADVASYSPGFTVGVLAEIYLHQHFALRFIPMLQFGDKKITFKEQGSGEQHNQSMKSVYLSFPVNLKVTAERFNNYRPYIVTGLSPTIDLSNTKQKALLTKSFDCYAEIGLGCDFYLPFFKLIPELKFSFGLANLLQKDRRDLTDLSLMKFTESLDGVKSKMITLSFYFE